jgi:hypothetical protein
MASDQCYLFAALATFNGDLQERLRDAQTPEAIVAIAADHGYLITVQQLSFFSSRLNGDHWREGFFARERQLDLQAA